MKKTIYSSVLMLAVLTFASAAMAATTIQGATTIGNASNSFTPSAKVGLKVLSQATAYAATSCHVNGTFQYGTVGGTGTTQDVSKIYQKTITAQGDATIGNPDAPDSNTNLGTGWQ